MTGKVKFFNDQKGFGFIAGDDAKDYFVHKSNVVEDIRKGDSVTFDLQEGKKGIKAVNVRHNGK